MVSSFSSLWEVLLWGLDMIVGISEVMTTTMMMMMMLKTTVVMVMKTTHIAY